MRIWSISAEYLDVKGLVALWRETLLAKHVLAGLTKGYQNHPQLNRFKTFPEPLVAIDQYLQAVYEEASRRNYKFDNSKFSIQPQEAKIPVTTGQIEYELRHISHKLSLRAPGMVSSLPSSAEGTKIMPIFTIVPGEVEDWEIVK